MDRRSLSLGGLGGGRAHAWQDAPPISPLHSSLNASLSSLNDRANLKSPPILGARFPSKSAQSPPHASLSTASPSFGSNVSINDLRAVVGSQQQQLDSLLDKVADLLSAQHVTRANGSPSRHAASPSRYKADVSKGEVAYVTDLREMEGGFRVWLQSEIHDMQDALQSKFRSLKDGMRYELRDANERLANEVGTMRVHLSHLENKRIDEDVETDIRQDLEAHVQSRMASLQSSMNDLRGNLAHELDALKSCIATNMAPPVQHDAALQQFASELRREMHTREPAGVSSSTVQLIREDVMKDMKEELREKTQPRLEAHAAQTFGMAQRLINELRTEIEGQAAQMNEATQRLAQELQVHMHTTVQEYVQSEMQHGLKELAVYFKSEKQQAATGSSGEVQGEIVADCQAAADDCMRCLNEAYSVAESLDQKLKSFAEGMQDSGGGARQNGGAAVNAVETKAIEAAAQRSEAAADAADKAAARAQENLQSCQAAAEQCTRIVEESSAAAESRLRLIGEEMTGKLAACGPTEVSASRSVEIHPDVKSGINDANKRMDALESKLLGQREPNGADKRMDDLESKLQGERGVDAAHKRTDELQKTWKELESKLQGERGIDGVHKRTDELENKLLGERGIDGASQRMDELEKELSELKVQAVKVDQASQPDKDQLVQRVDDMTRQLGIYDTLQKSGSKASEDVAKRVGDIDGELVKLRQSVEAMTLDKPSATAPSSDLISRVEEVERKLGATSSVAGTAVAKEEPDSVSISEVNGRVERLEAKVQQLGTLMMAFKQMVEPQDSGDDDEPSIASLGRCASNDDEEPSAANLERSPDGQRAPSDHSAHTMESGGSSVPEEQLETGGGGRDSEMEGDGWM